uniref:Uncharacterized protein n=1 Tax=viral metagenome TaxID=1070528 RepID=A0A6C0I4F0_9ZZZZ
MGDDDMGGDWFTTSKINRAINAAKTKPSFKLENDNAFARLLEEDDDTSDEEATPPGRWHVQANGSYQQTRLNPSGSAGYSTRSAASAAQRQRQRLEEEAAAAANFLNETWHVHPSGSYGKENPRGTPGYPTASAASAAAKKGRERWHVFPNGEYGKKDDDYYGSRGYSNSDKASRAASELRKKIKADEEFAAAAVEREYNNKHRHFSASNIPSRIPSPHEGMKWHVNSRGDYDERTVSRQNTDSDNSYSSAFSTASAAARANAAALVVVGSGSKGEKEEALEELQEAAEDAEEEVVELMKSDTATEEEIEAADRAASAAAKLAKEAGKALSNGGSIQTQIVLDAIDELDSAATNAVTVSKSSNSYGADDERSDSVDTLSLTNNNVPVNYTNYYSAKLSPATPASRVSLKKKKAVGEREIGDMFGAIEHSNLAGVKRGIDNGVDVNFEFDMGATLLHFACEQGNIPIIELLLERGADLNKKNDHGNTPFYNACVFPDNMIEVVRTLMKYGPDVNTQNNKGSSPVFWVSTNYPPEILEEFLEITGADVNIKNNNGLTPIDEVRKYWKPLPEVVKILEKYSNKRKGSVFVPDLIANNDMINMSTGNQGSSSRHSFSQPVMPNETRGSDFVPDLIGNNDMLRMSTGNQDSASRLDLKQKTLTPPAFDNYGAKKHHVSAASMRRNGSLTHKNNKFGLLGNSAPRLKRNQTRSHNSIARANSHSAGRMNGSVHNSIARANSHSVGRMNGSVHDSIVHANSHNSVFSGLHAPLSRGREWGNMPLPGSVSHNSASAGKMNGSVHDSIVHANSHNSVFSGLHAPLSRGREWGNMPLPGSVSHNSASAGKMNGSVHNSTVRANSHSAGRMNGSVHDSIVRANSHSAGRMNGSVHNSIVRANSHSAGRMNGSVHNTVKKRVRCKRGETMTKFYGCVSKAVIAEQKAREKGIKNAVADLMHLQDRQRCTRGTRKYPAKTGKCMTPDQIAAYKLEHKRGKKE